MNNELEEAHKALQETMAEVLKLRRENEDLRYRLTMLPSALRKIRRSRSLHRHSTAKTTVFNAANPLGDGSVEHGG